MIGPARLTVEKAELSAAKMAVEQPVVDQTPAEYQYTGHDLILLPKSEEHTHTVLLLHGLDDRCLLVHLITLLGD